MDTSAIQAVIRAAYDAVQAKPAEFARLVDKRKSLRISYFRDRDKKGRLASIWKRSLNEIG